MDTDMAKYCDLHTHSIYSDGTFTPAEIVNHAIDLGLSAVALTDHNTVDGLPDFISAARGKNIDAVSGCEFSVDYNDKELHLLGLFIKPDYFSQTSALMKEVLARKQESNEALINSLARAGIHLSYEEIKAQTPSGIFNRAHIASTMVQKGYVSSIPEAFSTYLSKS